jgi:hypothetical protein
VTLVNEATRAVHPKQVSPEASPHGGVAATCGFIAMAYGATQAGFLGAITGLVGAHVIVGGLAIAAAAARSGVAEQDRPWLRTVQRLAGLITVVGGVAGLYVGGWHYGFVWAGGSFFLGALVPIGTATAFDRLGFQRVLSLSSPAVPAPSSPATVKNAPGNLWETNPLATASAPVATVREVATVRLGVRLFERTIEVGADAPQVLRLERPDSRVRWMMYCVSTVVANGAPTFGSPQAVLNECVHACAAALMRLPVPDKLAFFGPTRLTRQELVNAIATCVQPYLDQWSEYTDLVSGGNGQAAHSAVCGVLRSIESGMPAVQGDAQRLEPLVRWIEGQSGGLRNAFDELTDTHRRPTQSARKVPTALAAVGR